MPLSCTSSKYFLISNITRCNEWILLRLLYGSPFVHMYVYAICIPTLTTSLYLSLSPCVYFTVRYNFPHLADIIGYCIYSTHEAHYFTGYTEKRHKHTEREQEWNEILPHYLHYPCGRSVLIQYTERGIYMHRYMCINLQYGRKRTKKPNNNKDNNGTALVKYRFVTWCIRHHTPPSPATRQNERRRNQKKTERQNPAKEIYGKNCIWLH